VALPSTPPIEAPPQPPVNTSAPAADELIIMPLAAQEAEIRRLKDLLEKQTQLTRELQHKLDQTQERLRALKAIERSLSQRAPTAPRAPQVPAP
jgi:septal ring factor EnvC (AmiA/AmiB activator)